MAGQRDVRVVGRILALTIPLVTVVALVVGAMALWDRGDLNRFICDGDCGPSNVVPPAELTIDAVAAPTGVVAAAAGPVDPAKLTAAVSSELSSEVLGSRVGFIAIDPSDEDVLASSGEGAFAPASTTKVVTSFAALATIDPQTRYATTVVRKGNRIVLVGGGDPYLATAPAKSTDDRVVRADLTTLARRTASALKKSGTTRVRLGFDTSLFAGPDVSPNWPASYLPDNVVTPISALWADQGVRGGVRLRDPAMAATQSFAQLLAKRGITVVGDPAPASAPAGARRIARVTSATVGQIVETLMRVSDNQAAEVMLRHVALAAGRPATFAGGAAAVKKALVAADVDVTGLRLFDGSGLSRDNRIAPVTLVQTIAAAASAPRTSGLAADLPVSGFTGTLVERFSGTGGALGTVRAKTGTLTGIHSLAGYALDRDGRPILFAVMADRVGKGRDLEARAALDRVAAAIADCRCG